MMICPRREKNNGGHRIGHPKQTGLLGFARNRLGCYCRQNKELHGTRAAGWYSFSARSHCTVEKTALHPSDR